MRRLILAGSLSILALAACGAPESPGRRTAATPTCRGAPGGVPNSTRPILGIHHVSSLTRERYDAVVRQLTNGRDRLESLSDGGLEGLVVHVAAQGDDGFWIIDVWESQEAVNRFGERIRPIAQAAGIREPMKTYAIQTFLAC